MQRTKKIAKPVFNPKWHLYGRWNAYKKSKTTIVDELTITNSKVISSKELVFDRFGSIKGSFKMYKV